MRPVRKPHFLKNDIPCWNITKQNKELPKLQFTNLCWFFCCYLPARFSSEISLSVIGKKAKKKSRKRSNIVQFDRWRDSFSSALCSILS